MKKLTIAAALVAVVMGTGAKCSDKPTPEQLRPTYAGPNGECMEADDELCDEDPFDTDDDDIHLPKPSKKASPRPMQTANQGKPSPKSTRK